MNIESEAHLAELLTERHVPVWLRGGATRGTLGVGEVLDLTGLSGVRLYEPETLTLVAGAGTPLDDLQGLLAGQGQHLAFEPPDWRGLLGTKGQPSLGGVVAANLSGPRRVQAGAARDFCLGVQFVDGTGMSVKNGGRVMKNVTGYDLVKMMAGSWGTLGVLTEVALKILPAPAAVVTLTLAPLTLAEAVVRMARALGSPYDPSGAAFLPDGRLFVRLEGLAQSVAYRAERLADLLGADVWTGADPWPAIRDVAPFHGRAGDVWRFSVTPSQAPEIAARLKGEVMLDWGGGLIWALLSEGTDARAQAAPYRGHALLVRASDETCARLPRFEPQAPAVAALTAGLRARFDPKNILNPGLMG
ncbi:MAG: FAD-binding protein [Rhodobacteraceae bacterium]|nr:FAD-binding protein [Paracoccaceae bacterium]